MLTWGGRGGAVYNISLSIQPFKEAVNNIDIALDFNPSVSAMITEVGVVSLEGGHWGSGCTLGELYGTRCALSAGTMDLCNYRSIGCTVEFCEPVWPSGKALGW